MKDKAKQKIGCSPSDFFILRIFIQISSRSTLCIARRFFYLLKRIYVRDGEGIARDGEFYLVIAEPHTVRSPVLLIGRARVVRKTFAKPRAFLFGYLREQVLGKFHLQEVIVFRGVSAQGVRVTVGEREIGFDVENGRTV